jgi:hypothetical protein
MRHLVPAFLLAIAAVSPAAAQSTLVDEPDYVADESAVLRDGFAILRQSDAPLTPEDRKIVDEKFAGPIAKSIDPKLPYGFTYAKVDLDGDGYQELVLSMRMAADTGGWGAATYIYRYDGKDWTRRLADQAMLVGYRLGKSGKADIALVDPDGYRLFVDGDGGYSSAGKGAPSEE